MPFKDNLKKYREKSGYTAKAFAKTINIAYTTYLTYENQGREPKFDTLIKIAAALHVSIDELLGYKADMANELTQSIQFLESIGFTINHYHSKQLEKYQDYFVITSNSFDERDLLPKIKKDWQAKGLVIRDFPKYSKNKHDIHTSRAVIPQTIIDMANWLITNETLKKNVNALYYQEAFKMLPFMGDEIKEDLEAHYWKAPPPSENEDASMEKKAQDRRKTLDARYIMLIHGKD